MSEKNGRSTRVGSWSVTTTDPHVTFGELLDIIDDALWADMRKDKSGVLMALYHFFNTNRRPLDLREFYEFLGSWTVEDKQYYELAALGLSEWRNAA
jgi:hypothetical protein